MRISKINIVQRIKSSTLTNLLKNLVYERKRITKSHIIENRSVSYNVYPIESFTFVKFIEV
jgi:hypothetical protein